MVKRVNATSVNATIDLFRLNNLLDIIDEEPNTQMFVGAQRNQMFPLV